MSHIDIRRYYRVEMNNNLLCMTCCEKTDEKCNMNFENQIIFGTGNDIPSLWLICNDSIKEVVKNRILVPLKVSYFFEYKNNFYGKQSVADYLKHVWWYLKDGICSKNRILI